MLTTATTIDPEQAMLGKVEVVVADTAVPLADLIDFTCGSYTLDTAAIRNLVNAATTADPRYTPSTARRQARWQQAFRALKRRCPNMSDVWYARQIAGQTGSWATGTAIGDGQQDPAHPFEP